MNMSTKTIKISIDDLIDKYLGNKTRQNQDLENATDKDEEQAEERERD